MSRNDAFVQHGVRALISVSVVLGIDTSIMLIGDGIQTNWCQVLAEISYVKHWIVGKLGITISKLYTARVRMKAN